MKEISQNDYNNFNIALKEPKYILNDHNGGVFCATVLYDGRLATGSWDNSIIIYNKETFKPDLKIKEHMDDVVSLIQLVQDFYVQPQMIKQLNYII